MTAAQQESIAFQPPQLLRDRRLEAFVRVAESGSFTTAARTMYVVQSTVSRDVQELESLVGFPLLVRTSSGARLTPRGIDFLHIVQRLRRAQAEVDIVVQELARAVPDQRLSD